VGNESIVAWLVEGLSDPSVDALGFITAVRATDDGHSPEVRDLLERLEGALRREGGKIDLARILRSMRERAASPEVGASLRLAIARAAPEGGRHSVATTPADVIYWSTPGGDVAFSIHKRDGWTKLKHNLETALVRQLVEAQGRPVPAAKVRAFATSTNPNKAEIVRRANKQLRGDSEERWIEKIGRRDVDLAYYLRTPHGRRIQPMTIASLDLIDGVLRERFRV
jgi:hypothetical protein